MRRGTFGEVKVRTRCQLSVKVMVASSSGAVFLLVVLVVVEDHLQLLQIHLKSSARQLKLGYKWVSDPKHASKLVS